MKKCDLSTKMAETWNGNLIFLLLQAESISEIYLIKIIYYNMLPLTSDRTRLEIMFRSMTSQWKRHWKNLNTIFHALLLNHKH